MATNNAINAPLPLAVTQGGFGTQTLAVDGILYGNAGDAVQVTAPGNTGTVLGGVTAGVPQMYTLTQGANVTITPDSGAKTITFASGGGGSNPATGFSYLAYRSTNTSYPAGTNTIICNTSIFDNGSNYNNGTGVTTITNAGVYMFGCTVKLTNGSGIVAPANASLQLSLYGGGGVYNYQLNSYRFRLNYSSGVMATYSTSVNQIVYMSANSTFVYYSRIPSIANGHPVTLVGGLPMTTYCWGYRLA